MDWLGSMRFHFAEALIYDGLLYVPLAVLGFRGEVLFALAVVGTAIGHCNHANLRLRIGPLRDLINSPEMRVWHHAHPDAGPTDRNFGINLAIGDWLFGAVMTTEPFGARRPRCDARCGSEPAGRREGSRAAHRFTRSPCGARRSSRCWALPWRPARRRFTDVSHRVSACFRRGPRRTSKAGILRAAHRSLWRGPCSCSASPWRC